ncbi:unnamed protein product [Durusdinium trenchii]|uniref:PDZ domain-containing protein n=1 Tax=Durusdinium trenchii TaxID=1381693 RepID=A0ABP0QFR0_9DINO
MAVTSWWATSTSAPRRHGTITVREVTCGVDVGKVGFGVASLPPQPVVLKKVTANSWASQQDLSTGDVLLELNGVQMSELSTQQFLNLMQTRPLCFKFIINPLKSSRVRMREDEGTSVASSRSPSASSSVQDEKEDEDLQATSRHSLSDWYAQEDGPSPRKASALTTWFLDGAELPDTGSRLTARHRLSGSAESGAPESELGALLHAALEKEDLESLLQVIVKAQAEGIMADLVEVARCKASSLQSRIAQLAMAAAF